MDRRKVLEALGRERGAHSRAAEAIGVSKQHLSGFLHEKEMLSIEPLLALVRYLRERGHEVDVEALMRPTKRTRMRRARPGARDARP